MPPKSPVYRPPLVFPPAQTHKTTIIILHGRGSTAQKFAEPLLTHPVSPLSTTASPSSPPTASPQTFHDYFPHTKFVFPTAPLRRAIIFKRSLIHQWFDNWSLIEPEVKQHLQIPGSRETSAFLHDLLQKESEVVGARNVVLMGLSQGCAVSIVATLLWEGEAFGAVVGMCGYLPFRKGMLGAAEDMGNGASRFVRDSKDDEDVFERDEEEPGRFGAKFERAIGWLREELQVTEGRGKNAEPPPMQSIPVFMGHGTEDEKVPCEFGKFAADFLDGIDVNVEWIEYEHLGHWYSADMLRDVVSFLKGLEGWEDIIRTRD